MVPRRLEDVLRAVRDAGQKPVREVQVRAPELDEAAHLVVEGGVLVGGDAVHRPQGGLLVAQRLLPFLLLGDVGVDCVPFRRLAIGKQHRVEPEVPAPFVRFADHFGLHTALLHGPSGERLGLGEPFVGGEKRIEVVADHLAPGYAEGLLKRHVGAAGDGDPALYLVVYHRARQARVERRQPVAFEPKRFVLGRRQRRHPRNAHDAVWRPHVAGQRPRGERARAGRAFARKKRNLRRCGVAPRPHGIEGLFDGRGVALPEQFRQAFSTEGSGRVPDGLPKRRVAPRECVLRAEHEHRVGHGRQHGVREVGLFGQRRGGLRVCMVVGRGAALRLACGHCGAGWSKRGT